MSNSSLWTVVILEWTGIEDATCLIWFLKIQIAGASYFIPNAKGNPSAVTEMSLIKQDGSQIGAITTPDL